MIAMNHFHKLIGIQLHCLALFLTYLPCIDFTVNSLLKPWLTEAKDVVNKLSTKRKMLPVTLLGSPSVYFHEVKVQ